MLRDNVVHFISQLRPFKGNVAATLLEIFNSEQIVFIAVRWFMLADMIVKSTGDISPVKGETVMVLQQMREQHLPDFYR